MLVRGCTDEKGQPLPTEWVNLTWEGETPSVTSIDVSVASGNSSNRRDPSWGRVTPLSRDPPACLQEVLRPNVTPEGPFDAKDGWLRVDFNFRGSPSAAPKLKSFKVTYRCPS
jgi:hypothetical protein